MGSNSTSRYRVPEKSSKLCRDVCGCADQAAAKCAEVSDAIAFLCSPAASYINGTSLVIDCAVTTTVRLHCSRLQSSDLTYDGVVSQGNGDDMLRLIQ